MKRLRLDQALVARGLVASRSKARDLILRGLVTVAGSPASKPAALVDDVVVIELPGEAAAHVSRGAVKLEAAMAAFGFDVDGRIALDVGSSTGGFTQVLLERGAAKVYAVDVGRDQLHQTLRDDIRVVALEETDARKLTCQHIVEPVDAIVADLSFISVTKALAAALKLAAKDAWLIALIKPQFEVGRKAVGKGGIVRNEADWQQAVLKVHDWLDRQDDWRVVDVIQSPITGAGGNEEFLIGAISTATGSSAVGSTDADSIGATSGKMVARTMHK